MPKIYQVVDKNYTPDLAGYVVGQFSTLELALKKMYEYKYQCGFRFDQEDDLIDIEEVEVEDGFIYDSSFKEWLKGHLEYRTKQMEKEVKKIDELKKLTN